VIDPTRPRITSTTGFFFIPYPFAFILYRATITNHEHEYFPAPAELYDIPVKVLNQAVKRNRDRFPEDFMFQLTTEESDSLRSHFVTLKTGRGRHRKYLPFAFTEHGVAMLSREGRAVNIEIMLP